MKNLGLQLYTIRDFMNSEKEIDESFAKIAELGYTEGQTARLPAVSDEQFVALAKKHGIKIVGTHYVYDKIINEPDAVMKTHDLWETKNIGIGCMPPVARESYDNLMSFIETFNKAAENYAKHGFKLTYHNHSFEFVRINGNKTIMDYLYENLDPKNTSFVLDTCWLTAGGVDVCEWLEKCRGRLDILHLKDMYLKKQDKFFVPAITEVGQGGVAWDRVMKTAEEVGVKHYVVEQDNNWSPDPMASLKISADFLAKYRA